MVSEIVNLHILGFISQLKGTVWSIWEMFWVYKDSMSHVWRQRPCLVCYIVSNLYVTLCPINAQWNKNSCCQVLMCLQYCCSCFTDHCSVITSDYVWILFYLMLFYLMWILFYLMPDVDHFFFVCANEYLVQNQTVTVQNGPNFREIYICLRDLLSCLMLCYRVYFVSICLKAGN